MAFVQAHHGGEDGLMALVVKIRRLDNLRRVSEYIVVNENRAEQAHLGVNILRWNLSVNLFRGHYKLTSSPPPIIAIIAAVWLSSGGFGAASTVISVLDRSIICNDSASAGNALSI